ncbi:MAG: hypothetical protein ACPG6V_07050 [Flavobacteriales bacterium]
MKKILLIIFITALNIVFFAQNKEVNIITKKVKVINYFGKVPPCGIFYNIGVYKAKVLDSFNENIFIYTHCESFNNKLAEYGIAKLEINEENERSDRL